MAFFFNGVIFYVGDSAYQEGKRAVQTEHNLQSELQGVNNDIKSVTCPFRIRDLKNTLMNSGKLYIEFDLEML